MALQPPASFRKVQMRPASRVPGAGSLAASGQAPTVSVSGGGGSWNHGATQTVTGGTFGTKTGGAPTIWDDAQGTDPLDKWDIVYPYEASNSAHDLQYRSVPYRSQSVPTNSRATKFIAACGNGGGPTAGNDLGLSKHFTMAYPFKAYASWYARVDDNWQYTGSDGNFKWFYMGDGSDEWTASNDYWYAEYNPGLDSAITTDMEFHINGPFNGSLYFGSAIHPVGVWIKFEMELYAATSTTGYIKHWQNGTLKINNADGPGVGNSAGAWYLAIGGFQRAYDSNNFRFWSGVYLDMSSFARVLLGNASTLASSTVREPQIITSWSTSSIGITVNLGTLASSSTAYVHVVKEDGSVLDDVMDAVTLGS
jgi:hypothetical protein